jgi:hypothetical protein
MVQSESLGVWLNSESCRVWLDLARYGRVWRGIAGPTPILQGMAELPHRQQSDHPAHDERVPGNAAFLLNKQLGVLWYSQRLCGVWPDLWGMAGFWEYLASCRVWLAAPNSNPTIHHTIRVYQETVSLFLKK